METVANTIQNQHHEDCVGKGKKSLLACNLKKSVILTQVILFSCDLMTTFSVVFLFFFFLCVSTVDFLFVATKKLQYCTLYIDKIL